MSGAVEIDEFTRLSIVAEGLLVVGRLMLFCRPCRHAAQRVGFARLHFFFVVHSRRCAWVRVCACQGKGPGRGGDMNMCGGLACGLRGFFSLTEDRRGGGSNTAPPQSPPDRGPPRRRATRAHSGSQSPGSRKLCLASGGCNFGKTRPWLGLVDLSRIPSGTFFFGRSIQRRNSRLCLRHREK